MTQQAVPKPTFKEALRELNSPAPPVVEDLSEPDDEGDDEGAPKPEAAAIPEWAAMPPGLVMPEGWQIHFMRFRAAWTNLPRLGDRTCVLWNLTEADEKLAARRARGDANRIIDEMSKQMVRVIDGARTDWTKGGANNIERFWDEIGGKCRHLVRSYYLKTHTLEAKDFADFFDNCVAVRTHTG
jgi:hypothetical protein